MKLFTLIRTFRNDEDGAVTVDWVVLTAAIVGLGIAVLSSVAGGINGLGDKINTSLNAGEVKSLTDLATASDGTTTTGTTGTGG